LKNGEIINKKNSFPEAIKVTMEKICQIRAGMFKGPLSNILSRKGAIESLIRDRL